MKLNITFTISIMISLILTKINADFAVISDIHYDAYYTVGSPTSCVLGKTGMGCCRKWDIGNGSAPEFGTSGCDTPKALIEKIFEYLSNQDLEFLVYLGDTVDHDLLIQGWDYNLAEIQTVGNLTKTLPFPVFTLLGNHDGFIVDNLWTNEWGTEWLKATAQATGSNLISGGYYSITRNNTVMIFLNCLTYDTHNIQVRLEPDSDLFNQTAWLKDQIAQAEEGNLTVFLFSHFGSDTGEATDFYNEMISNFSYGNIIYFAGHSHHDEIRRFGTDKIFYIHPSIVPDEHFPEMRIYVTSKEDMKIIDYIQYGFNLTSGEIEKVYSAKDSYSLADLSNESWSDFFDRMSRNSTLQDIYNSHYSWGM